MEHHNEQQGGLPASAIKLIPSRVICARHGELFKPRWPVGYDHFAFTLFEILNQAPPFIDLVEQRAAADGTELIRAIEAVLDEQPMCCRVGPNALLEVYQATQKKETPWECFRCVLCHRLGYGAAYRKQRPSARTGPQAVGVWRHVCLRCVTHGQEGR